MSSSDGLAARSLRVICGPTASGKSALAVELAERVGAAIVSADSRQIYRGFDIGTAKPTAKERERVPHFGIDVADPTERYSAARWTDDAETWLDAAEAQHRLPMIVGGTGFYVRSLVTPLFREPPLDPIARAALETKLGALSLSELRRWCDALDPSRARLGRTQLLRAIETALLTGERLSVLHERETRAPRYTARYLVLDPGPVLQERIAARIDGMFAAGWMDEVLALATRVTADAPAWLSSGYDAVRRAVHGVISIAEAREAVLVETRQYAKRQRTWLRHQIPPARVTRLNPESSGALDRALEWWNAEEDE